MANKADIDFHKGEDWHIELRCTDADDEPIDLTGAVVQARVASTSTVMLDLSSPDDITISDAAGGVVTITITPAQQAAILAGPYGYHIRATLASGTITDQVFGSLMVRETLFSRFA